MASRPTTTTDAPMTSPSESIAATPNQLADSAASIGHQITNSIDDSDIRFAVREYLSQDSVDLASVTIREIRDALHLQINQLNPHLVSVLRAIVLEEHATAVILRAAARAVDRSEEFDAETPPEGSAAGK